jgi:L-ribulose-5-phosphate 4-epimerase
MVETLKEQVLRANRELAALGLVTLTWGNVSGIDRSNGLVVIKPSGVDYEEMSAGDMAVVDLNGTLVEGKLKPSSDTPTHVALYNAFPAIGGIAHSHSTYATIFAQACKEIPCYGTTHADHFHGSVPVTRFLTEEEVRSAYELNTGRVIIERFAGIDPAAVPGVLVGGHAPFAWGTDPADAVRNNLVLERIAKMALYSMMLRPDLEPLPKHITDKHYTRKHGPDAYYGQTEGY